MNDKSVLFLVVGLIIGFATGMLIAKSSSQPRMFQQQVAPPIMPTMAPQSNNNSAQIAAQKARLAEKINELKQAVKENPGNMAALVDLGNIHFDTGQHHEAIDYYKKALVINPDQPNVLVDIGIMYRRTAQPEEAVKSFKKAAAINPNHLYAYSNLGVVYSNDMNDLPKAIEAFKMVVKINPPNDPDIVAAAKQTISKLQMMIDNPSAARSAGDGHNH